MALLALWVNEHIKHSVLQTSGAQGAAFMQGFLEPRVQDLQPGGELSAERRRDLDALFIGTALGRSVVSIKIWRADGTVIYSTTPDLIGQQFVSSDVARAATGEIVAEYEDLISQESAFEQTLDMALIEVYAPLFRTGTEEVIAVGEIYENADALAAELNSSRVIIWTVVGITTLFMLGVLYAIVRRGGATIAEQREELRSRLRAMKALAEQNERLRHLAEEARLKANQANEHFLGRMGSDIHDGPIQLLTLSVLKLSTVVRALKGRVDLPRAPEEEIESAISITDEALADLRNISSGLSLPEIESLNVCDAVALAISRHEDHAGLKVEFTGTEATPRVSEAVKLCAYRVVQEALTNSQKHAPGAKQSVSLRVMDDMLFIAVSDDGPGIGAVAEHYRPKLGLSGMKNRVDALSGSIQLQSDATRGTTVQVALPLEAVGDTVIS